MSATPITVQNMTPAGINVTFTAASATGNHFTNDGRTFMIVRNTGGTSITVTIASPNACDQGFTHPQDIAVPGGQDRYIGPFNPARFNDSNGRVNVTYSAVTNVTVAAVRLS